ncbi:hypothetical protein [Trueperella pyogenes]
MFSLKCLFTLVVCGKTYGGYTDVRLIRTTLFVTLVANIDSAQVAANVPNTRAELEETVPYSRISAGGGACLASLLASALVSAPLSANAAELQRVSPANIAIDRYDNLLTRVNPLLSFAEVAVADARQQPELNILVTDKELSEPNPKIVDEYRRACRALAIAQRNLEDATMRRSFL